MLHIDSMKPDQVENKLSGLIALCKEKGNYVGNHIQEVEEFCELHKIIPTDACLEAIHENNGINWLHMPKYLQILCDCGYVPNESFIKYYKKQYDGGQMSSSTLNKCISIIIIKRESAKEEIMNIELKKRIALLETENKMLKNEGFNIAFNSLLQQSYSSLELFKIAMTGLFKKYDVTPNTNHLKSLELSLYIRWCDMPEIIELFCSLGFLPNNDLYDYYHSINSISEDKRKSCEDVIVKYIHRNSIVDKNTTDNILLPVLTNDSPSGVYTYLPDIGNTIKLNDSTESVTNFTMSSVRGSINTDWETPMEKKVNSLINQMKLNEEKSSKNEKAISELTLKVDEQNTYIKELEKRIQTVTIKLGEIDGYELITQ